MNEEKILNQIKQSANSCEVPESLKPENIANKLVDIEEKPRNTRKKIYQIGGVVAAALVLVVGVSAMTGGFGRYKSAQMEAGQPAAVMEEAAAETETVASVESFSQMFKTADSYEDVQKTVEQYEKELQRRYEEDMAKADLFVEESATTEEMAPAADTEAQAAAEMAPAADTGAPAAAEMGWGSEDYSDTNLQVEGVDEGDVVKTDGKYIYVITSRRELRIIKADSTNLSEITTLAIDPDSEMGDINIMEIYVSADKVHIVISGYGSSLLSQGNEGVYYLQNNSTVSLLTYDVSQPEAPALLGKVTQEGEYNSSRKVGNYFYLFTSFWPSYTMENEMARGDFENMVPYVGDGKIQPASIYLPINPTTYNYMVITSVDLTQPDRFLDEKAIMEDARDIYVTANNIYVRKENWDENGDSTSIAKFSFKDGKIEGESAGSVAGTITDTFAINEHSDTLRVLTTVWGNMGDVENHVTVFDAKMKMIGKIDGLAPGETIYSARFFGDIGYFVTYRNMDPLFTVDFSDPHNPKILGELKITGFSEYLHPYGENRLLGIGWETDPETSERLGLKLSMFDISNPSDVKEINKMVIKNVNAFPGEYDYKAFTISATKNTIGFTVFGTNPSGDMNGNYMIFAYDENKGFESKLVHEFVPKSPGYFEHEKARGLYVADTFYIATEYEVFAFDMKDDYKKVGEFLS